MSTLLFFVPSLPDETIQSRVARHHLLSGNRMETQTFLDLFDSAPSSLEDVVPPGLNRLADRMGDAPNSALQILLERNTLLPLFEPFLRGTPHSGLAEVGAMVNRLPRRVVGHRGEAHLCMACVEEDLRTIGMPYWHRAHHVPGVTVCWRHRIRLTSSCPHCRRPFQLASRLLRQPWRACPCGWHVNEMKEGCVADSLISHRYAQFAYDLLDRPLFGRSSIPFTVFAFRRTGVAFREFGVFCTGLSLVQA
ncbi:TniQ family protein, partial [Burkholderia pseudomallei]|uniref:TniQ family protein n=1 Tax=Burkholderia pseudomallei TaxID=28450 RepID=UPI000A94DF80